MQLRKIFHYIQRTKQVGIKKAGGIVLKRFSDSYFSYYYKKKAAQKKAALCWSDITKKYTAPSFKNYFPILQNRPSTAWNHMYDQQYDSDSQLFKQAEKYVNNEFEILGATLKKAKTIDWHADFGLKNIDNQADDEFDSDCYYKDFIISNGQGTTRSKDIKVPWELSRFQHLVILSKAYQKSNNGIYAQTFVKHVSSWIENNPYLLGPNWVCPMDVSLRALNWVWAFDYFKYSEIIKIDFWQTFTESLYNHMIYLENNWETGTYTSNHYLSDLVGYFALTYFFSDLNGVDAKREWCYAQIMAEFEKQVFDEGTDYEGSTKYHGLVTELFYHFYLLCKEMDLPISASFESKLKKMFLFIQACYINKSDSIIIGDDDSGKAIDGLPADVIHKMAEPVSNTHFWFKQFGLSIIKTKEWHISLRHHAFEKRQPSGHFHNDCNSITVAVNGIPVIVDPGSYLYTPSAFWRNRFRGVAVHNTFFIEQKEPVAFNSDYLFNLALPENKSGINPFVAQHSLYGMQFKRELQHNNNQLILTDSIDTNKKMSDAICWNFTLSPDIIPVFKQNVWHLIYQNKTILTLKAQNLKFKAINGWFAPGYGVKKSCQQVVAKSVCIDHPKTIIFSRI